MVLYNVAQSVSREGTSPRSHASALATEPVAVLGASCFICTTEVIMTLDGPYGMQYSMHATLPYRCYLSCYNDDKHFVEIYQAQHIVTASPVRKLARDLELGSTKNRLHVCVIKIRPPLLHALVHGCVLNIRLLFCCSALSRRPVFC